MQMADDEESPFEQRKILVRDLAPNTTQDYLNRYFGQFGDVTEAIIPHNCVTGSPHSFGFVVFRHPLRIPFILQLPHCIHDRCVEVSRALKLGENHLQTLESQRIMTSTGDYFERPENFDERRIFVQGSPRPGITNDEFLKYFQGFGNVIDCHFWNDIGFGHITFRIKRNADRVLYRPSYILNGKRLTVNRLKHIPRDHNDAHNPNVSRTINIQEEAAASSGGHDHVNGTKDMQPQAATSNSDSRNMQIILATTTSGTDRVNDTRDMQPQAAESVGNTRDRQSIPAAASSRSGTHPPNNRERRNHRGVINIQQEAAESSGTDHVDGVKDMQPQAAASVSNTRNMQIVPAAVNFDLRNMQIVPAAANSYPGNWQIIPATANSDPRNMQMIPAGARASFHTNVGHIYASGWSNFPPSYQSTLLHYRPQMDHMVPGVPLLHFPGLHPALHQAYNGMGIYTNSANNFPLVAVRNYASYGNFPMALTDYSDQDFY